MEANHFVDGGGLFILSTVLCRSVDSVGKAPAALVKEARKAVKDILLIFFPLLYTLQASISKPMAITNSNRHAFDGRTYRRISNQIPIRDPMGSTIPEASGFLITIKRSLNQN